MSKLLKSDSDYNITFLTLMNHYDLDLIYQIEYGLPNVSKIEFSNFTIELAWLLWVLWEH